MISQPLKAFRARALQMASQELPEFVRAIEQAKKEGVEIDLSLKTFPGGSELLYLCLWLAYDADIVVRLLPKQRKTRK